MKTVCKGRRAPIPLYVLPKLADLIAVCWANEPSKRPSFDDIIPTLEQIENSLPQQNFESPYPGYYYDQQLQQYVPYSQQHVGYYQQQTPPQLQYQHYQIQCQQYYQQQYQQYQQYQHYPK